MNNQLTLEVVINTLKRISQGSPDYLLDGFYGSDYGLCCVVEEVISKHNKSIRLVYSVYERVFEIFKGGYGDNAYPLGEDNYYRNPKWFGEEGIKRRKLAGELAEYLEQCKEEILADS